MELTIKNYSNKSNNMKRIAIGSKNPVKVNACKNVMEKLYGEVEIIPVEIDSGISHTPLTDEETIKGARNRAYQALEKTKADMGVGMEGGITKITGRYFLTGWCVVIDKEGREGIGGGSTLELPSFIVEKVKEGIELGKVMDSIIGENNTKQKYGAIGIFTNMLLDRQKAWEIMLIYAMGKL